MPRPASSPAIRSHACRRAPVGAVRRRSDICTDSSSPASFERSMRRLVEGGCGIEHALAAVQRGEQAQVDRGEVRIVGAGGAQRRDRADVAHARRGLGLRIVGRGHDGAQR